MDKKILVVDDDVDVQYQMKIILEENGFNTVIADNAGKAWEIVEREPVDLILLDVMMEKNSDGFNFAQKLKTNDALKKIPIIMVTSVNQKMPFHFDTGDGDFLPVEKFIEKPIQPDKILEAVYQFI
jgi:CheY-like chemotaxis protein